MGDQFRRWKTLLSWLKDSHGMQIDNENLLVECKYAPGAGKGLFAACPIPPNTALFTIPATAMINSRTLSKIYPPLQGRTLSPVQMISLHLLLYKPPTNGDSEDPLFGPFIDTMPKSFDSHPLVWSVAIELGIRNMIHYQNLLSTLPPSTSSSLHDLKSGFWKDWDAIRSYVTSRPTTSKIPACNAAHLDRFRKEDLGFKMDYTWAWLSVNTRCIYYRLDPLPSSSLNMTLCPILDFANHAPHDTHILPVLPPVSQPPVPTSGPGKRSRSLGGDYTFVSNCEGVIPEDTELFLRYGAHSNRRLLVEYGFVNIWNEGDVREGRFDGEVDVNDVVEACFTAKGFLGDQMREILEEEGYWGDWTLHSTPQPAHPSYRLVTALRLLHCTEDQIQNEIQSWKDVLLGEKDVISQTNEQLWKQTMLDICKTISSRATENLKKLDQRDSNGIMPEWYHWAMGNVKKLWLEELEVASCVANSIIDGVDF